jgi:hypothetical protein
MFTFRAANCLNLLHHGFAVKGREQAQWSLHDHRLQPFRNKVQPMATRERCPERDLPTLELGSDLQVGFKDFKLLSLLHSGFVTPLND